MLIVAEVSLPKQAAEPKTVYVIIAVPAATPVTKPEDELTVAIVLSELDHKPPEIVELTVVVVPEHIVASVTVKVPVEGV